MNKKPAKKRLIVKDKKLKDSMKVEKINIKKDFFELVKRSANTSMYE